MHIWRWNLKKQWGKTNNFQRKNGDFFRRGTYEFLNEYNGFVVVVSRDQ
jgi:hypothetical protein